MIGGATYAYFSVTLFNNFGTRTITAEAGNAGSVTLNGTNANLTMDLTVADMRLMGHVPYYASSSGKTTTPTEVTIGTATVGSNNDTNYYKCSYTLNVTKSGTMYDAFTSNSNPTKGKDQIILTIDNREYDWYSEAFPTTINGTFIVKSESDYQIKAGLRIINDIVEQNAIAGTNINISLNESIENNNLIDSPLPFKREEQLLRNEEKNISHIDHDVCLRQYGDHGLSRGRKRRETADRSSAQFSGRTDTGLSGCCSRQEL